MFATRLISLPRIDLPFAPSWDLLLISSLDKKTKPFSDRRARGNGTIALGALGGGNWDPSKKRHRANPEMSRRIPHNLSKPQKILRAFHTCHSTTIGPRKRFERATLLESPPGKFLLVRRAYGMKLSPKRIGGPFGPLGNFYRTPVLTGATMVTFGGTYYFTYELAPLTPREHFPPYTHIARRS